VHVFRVLTLNSISPEGLRKLPADRYEVGDRVTDPDAVLVRSAKMHEMEILPGLKAVGRAGAGVNNIPVDRMSARGIPVFNAPGANANAVKELVVLGLILGCRQIVQAWDYTRALSGTDQEIEKAVEAGKKQFRGSELPGRTLGVVGLGAIGRLVANAGVALGMRVVGFDPGLTIDGAWQLSSEVSKAQTLDALLQASDFVTVHVPLNDATRHLINADRLRAMKPGVVVLNFARDGIVDDAAVVQALDAGHVAAYISDFPTSTTKNHPKAVTLPHLGASTNQAEDNCAVMVANQVRDFLEDGHVRHAVNFPELVVPRGTPHRFICANANVPSMLGRISEAFGQAGLNIHTLANTSRGDLAYTVADLDAPITDDVVSRVGAIDGVIMARRV
jgi:D-3-phosphoglycerate dehydrogenase